MEQIKYPIGIQTFEDIIEGDYLYVDKTDMVYEIAKRYRYVFLSRPRRFGKSLLTSTFEAYFKGKREFFNGLSMEHLEKEWICYPVFRFDFSPANYIDLQRLMDRFDGCLERIERQYELSATGKNPQERFLSLIEGAYTKFKRKIVILVDEYDKPLLDSLHLSDLHENLKDELRGFYSAIKASDQYIKFVLLTGTTKEALSDGSNNFKDISEIPRYESICDV